MSDDPHASQSEEVVQLSTEDELRAMSSLVRHRILGVLRDGPATITQIAKRLEIAKGSSSYHLRRLERAGLVSVVSTRKVRGVVERYYVPTARTIKVPATAPGQKQVLMRHALADLEAATDTSQQMVRLMHVRLDEDGFALFTKKMAALLEELAAANQPGHAAATAAIAFFRPVDTNPGGTDGDADADQT